MYFIRPLIRRAAILFAAFITFQVAVEKKRDEQTETDSQGRKLIDALRSRSAAPSSSMGNGCRDFRPIRRRIPGEEEAGLKVIGQICDA